MTNLVVCCDGTWKRADDPTVSNIERIARAIARGAPDGQEQVVYYSPGVGTGGSRVERLLGGAFGLGLNANIVDAYRFLALNYRPGDHLYVFGFSRGAYTARSLLGMIAAVGLLTPNGVAAGLLPQAIELYRSRPHRDTTTGPVSPPTERARVFAAACHPAPDVSIRFLGVFDTVGALGIPGIGRAKYRFHDLELSGQIQTARQALALAERRRIFAPSVWAAHHRDIKQVWFDGVHTDVGGGYAESAIADVTLRWMVAEAAARGLAFDVERILPSLRPEPVVVHDSLSWVYRISNAMLAAGRALNPILRRVRPARFQRGWRHLNPMTELGRAYDVRVARSAYARAQRAEPGWPVNPNIGRWFAEVESYHGKPGMLLWDVPGWPEQAR